LGAVAVELMRGSDAAARDFVRLLPADLRGRAGDAFQQLQVQVYGRMLRDHLAFMAFKAPESPEPIELARFQDLVEVLLSGGSVAGIVTGLSLDEAFVLYSSTNRILAALRSVGETAGGVPLRPEIAEVE
jgi:hypothetical protein